MATSSPQHPTRNRSRQNRPFTDPRAAALAVLDRVDMGKTTLDAVLDDSAPRLTGLSRRDRALFNQLVYGVLRRRLRLDAVVASYADRPFKKISPPILNILRIGLFQILFMDRIPASAAVNTAVNLVRARKASKTAGFVNALLRNALRDPDRFCIPDALDSPVDHIAVAHAFPHWLASRWIDRMGLAQTDRLCAAMNTIPPITLRCNRLKNNLAELVKALSDQAEAIEIVNNRPRRSQPDPPPSPHPGNQGLCRRPLFRPGRGCPAGFPAVVTPTGRNRS